MCSHAFHLHCEGMTNLLSLQELIKLIIRAVEAPGNRLESLEIRAVRKIVSCELIENLKLGYQASSGRALWPPFLALIADAANLLRTLEKEKEKEREKESSSPLCNVHYQYQHLTSNIINPQEMLQVCTRERLNERICWIAVVARFCHDFISTTWILRQSDLCYLASKGALFAPEFKWSGRSPISCKRHFVSDIEEDHCCVSNITGSRPHVVTESRNNTNHTTTHNTPPTTINTSHNTHVNTITHTNNNNNNNINNINITARSQSPIPTITQTSPTLSPIISPKTSHTTSPMTKITTMIPITSNTTLISTTSASPHVNLKNSLNNVHPISTNHTTAINPGHTISPEHPPLILQRAVSQPPLQQSQQPQQNRITTNTGNGIQYPVHKANGINVSQLPRLQSMPHLSFPPTGLPNNSNLYMMNQTTSNLHNNTVVNNNGNNNKNNNNNNTTNGSPQFWPSQSHKHLRQPSILTISQATTTTATTTSLPTVLPTIILTTSVPAIQSAMAAADVVESSAASENSAHCLRCHPLALLTQRCLFDCINILRRSEIRASTGGPEMIEEFLSIILYAAAFMPHFTRNSEQRVTRLLLMHILRKARTKSADHPTSTIPNTTFNSHIDRSLVVKQNRQLVRAIIASSLIADTQIQNEVFAVMHDCQSELKRHGVSATTDEEIDHYLQFGSRNVID